MWKGWWDFPSTTVGPQADSDLSASSFIIGSPTSNEAPEGQGLYFVPHSVSSRVSVTQDVLCHICQMSQRTCKTAEAPGDNDSREETIQMT